MPPLLGQLVYVQSAELHGLFTSPGIPESVREAYRTAVVERYGPHLKRGDQYGFVHQPTPTHTLFGWLYKRDHGRPQAEPYCLAYHLPCSLGAVELDMVLALLERGPVELPGYTGLRGGLQAFEAPNFWDYRPLRGGIEIPVAVREQGQRQLERRELVDLFVADPPVSVAPPESVTPISAVRHYPTRNAVERVPAGQYRYGGSPEQLPLHARQFGRWLTQPHRHFDWQWVSVQESARGLEWLLRDQISLLYLHRSLTDEERRGASASGVTLVQVPVAFEENCWFTQEQLGVPGLSLTQLQAIWNGEIVNWQVLGGPALPVVLFSAASELRSPGRHVQIVADTGEMIAGVRSTPGALGHGSVWQASGKAGIRTLALTTDSRPQAKLILPTSRVLFVVFRADDSLGTQAAIAHTNLLLTTESQLQLPTGFAPLPAIRSTKGERLHRPATVPLGTGCKPRPSRATFPDTLSGVDIPGHQSKHHLLHRFSRKSTKGRCPNAPKKAQSIAITTVGQTVVKLVEGKVNGLPQKRESPRIYAGECQYS